MKSTVRIENVGPIKFAEIDLQKYMVLIGEQASGKSTIAKVVYNLTNIAEVIREGFYNLIFLDQLNNQDSILKIIKKSIASTFLNIENFESGKIVYCLDNKEVVSFSYGGEIVFSSELNEAIKQIAASLLEAFNILNIKQKNTYLNFRTGLYNLSLGLIEQKIKNTFFKKTDHYFSDPNDDVLKQLNTGIPLINGSETWEEINKYSFKILKGTLTRINEEPKIFILLEGINKLISIDNLSSGQKYSLTIFNILKSLSFASSSICITIEEPETHLFPAAQSDVTKAIITFANQPEKDNRVFITTHSPYVLSTINNLLYAGQLSEDKRTDVEKLKAVVPEHLWMKPSDFACYKVKDGVLEDLVVTLDSGIKQIDQEYIDSISNVLIDEMNQLILIDPNDE